MENVNDNETLVDELYVELNNLITTPSVLTEEDTEKLCEILQQFKILNEEAKQNNTISPFWDLVAVLLLDAIHTERLTDDENIQIQKVIDKYKEAKKCLAQK